MNITDADREAALKFMANWDGSTNIRGPLSALIADHRLRGYNAGLEAAAKACDAVQRRMGEDPDFGASIATKAIRAMIEGETDET